VIAGVDGFSAGLARSRPEYAAAGHRKAARGQHVIDAQATMAFGGEIGGNMSWIAAMAYVLIGELLHRERPAGAGGSE
jgi:hypothetical protein